jgi:EpsI family protein
MTAHTDVPAVQPSRTAGRSASFRSRWWGTLLAGALLLAGGFAYRLTAAAVAAELAAKIRLDPPLASLPHVLGSWVGEDVPLSEGVQRIAGNDDFVSRRYRHCGTGEQVHLYVAYTARPRTMLRHRPTVCYTSAGWSHVGTRLAALEAPASWHEPWPLLLHSFLKPNPTERRVVVLNYYVLNGRVTVDEHSFWGLPWRDPNLGRNASRYVAQVQIAVPVLVDSPSAEQTVRTFASASGNAILLLLPRIGDLARAPTTGSD